MKRGTWASNPVTPALIAATVALAGVAVGALVSIRQAGISQDNADRQRLLEVARIKRDIVAAVNDYDLPTARLLMAHVLEPIDNVTQFQRFSQEFLDLVASKAAGSDPRAKELERQSEPVDSSRARDPRELVTLFEGPERLLASNALLEAYKARSAEVIAALVSAILPDDDRRSYRVNLYIAYTLGRLPGGWAGTTQQVRTIRMLTGRPSYSDPTFRARVDEALRNLRSTGT